MKNLKKILFIAVIIIVLSFIIYSIREFYTGNIEIENSLSVEGIKDDIVREGIQKEKDKIKKDRMQKVIVGEVILLVVSIPGIILIDKKIKA